MLHENLPAFQTQPRSNSSLLLRFKEDLGPQVPDEYARDFDVSEKFDFSPSKYGKTKGISFVSASAGHGNHGSPFVEQARSTHNAVDIATESLDKHKLSNSTRDGPSSLGRLPTRSHRRSLGGITNTSHSSKPVLNNPIDLPKRPAPQHMATKVNQPKHPVINTPLSKPRLSLVKVSLTPAQKVPRNTHAKLKNALEDFEFSNLVGRGAFANVYKGTNLKTKQVVAIKQIILERDQDVGDLMNEIDLLKILKHPHIVKYHGFVKTSATLNVFLEFCSGGSLRQLYKSLGHGLPEGQLSTYVEGILLGLEYLHQQGVVHRDVKAANVLLSGSGVIKLADFGVASRVTSQHQTVVGTPNWMAPETILGGEGLCTASDIWALGATIIELFTTNPPYHDLNPMATLHAIGTDDHPPLPKGLSPLARDLLLECFQKQPGLRISALLLLKHKWITGSERKASRVNLRGDETSKANCTQETPVETSYPSSAFTGKPIEAFAEPANENWSNDFEDPGTHLQENPAKTTISRDDLLHKFVESQEDIEFGTQTFRNPIRKTLHIHTDDDSDPFLDIEVDDFNTKELEIQTKMEYLMSKLSSRVEDLRLSEESVPSLVKITGRMLHMIKKYETLHQVFTREHGTLTLLELLDSVEIVKGELRLWFHALSILNIIFAINVAQLENFCLLGGIPLVAQFRSSSFDLPVRLQVIRFVKLLGQSDKALSMFVSCGGLRVLAKFVQEDLDSAPDFSLVSIDCIHLIITNDLSRSKSDICRMLSKYGIVLWFVVLLNGLTNEHKNIEPADAASGISKIMDIVKFFGQSEAKVRAAISSSELFRLMIRVYPKVEFGHRMTILKFLRSISGVSSSLRQLQNADILDFLVALMRQYTPTEPHYREVVNIVSPLLYNCCYLNGTQEIELVRLGAVPLLKALSVINLPFRQFVLPILCELVQCSDSVRQVLHKHDISKVYLNLVLDPYWQSTALEALLHWQQANPSHIQLTSPHTINCLVGGLSVLQGSNIESTLDSYLKLMMASDQLRAQMVTGDFVRSLAQKLAKHRSPVVQLGILRIIKIVAVQVLEGGFTGMVMEAMEKVSQCKTSVLVTELAREIIEVWNA